MADDTTIDGRVTALEQTAERHETRITAHGKEIDELHDMLINERAGNRYRDEAMQRIESKQDKLSGKIDTLLMQPAEKWNSATKTIVTVIVTAVTTLLLSYLGIAAK